MLWYWVVSFVLYRSAVFSKPVSQGSFSLSDVFHWCVCFTFTTLDHINEIFRSTCYRLLDKVSLASVFECTWWYTVFNEGTGFASDGVAFLYGRCVWSKCLWLTFDQNLSCEQAPKWSGAKRKLASEARPWSLFLSPRPRRFSLSPRSTWVTCVQTTPPPSPIFTEERGGLYTGSTWEPVHRLTEKVPLLYNYHIRKYRQACHPYTERSALFNSS